MTTYADDELDNSLAALAARYHDEVDLQRGVERLRADGHGLGDDLPRDDLIGGPSQMAGEAAENSADGSTAADQLGGRALSIPNTRDNLGLAKPAHEVADRTPSGSAETSIAESIAMPWATNSTVERVREALRHVNTEGTEKEERKNRRLAIELLERLAMDSDARSAVKGGEVPGPGNA